MFGREICSPCCRASFIVLFEFFKSSKILGKHPILAVFHTNKQPLYVWQHIRVIGYLKFEGSIFVSSSSVISGRGLERASFIHLYGSMSASLQHATKV